MEIACWTEMDYGNADDIDLFWPKSAHKNPIQFIIFTDIHTVVEILGSWFVNNGEYFLMEKWNVS